LQSFADEHRRTTWSIYRGTNAVASLFTDERPIARFARQAVLTLAGRAPLVSRLIKGRSKLSSPARRLLHER
jgi:2-polyprenyl-6-methoxyphenol hydroxylase-like FAD-dependent oxidoreductase